LVRSEAKWAYLDTSVLISWLQIIEPSIAEKSAVKMIKLPKAAQKCKELLDVILEDRLRCGLRSSDWALSEMIQYFRDRAVLKQFLYDGYAISSFNRYKHKYPMYKGDREEIFDNVRDFEAYLRGLDIKIVKTEIDKTKIHDYSLRYALETPDALHILSAKNSNYLVTTDDKLIESKVAEIEIIDPRRLMRLASR
jgi:predicted nucleic acid-binding protein